MSGVSIARVFITLVLLATLLTENPVCFAEGGRLLSLNPTTPVETEKLKVAEETKSAAVPSQVDLSREGAWGQVEYFSALLEAPDAVLEATMPTSFQVKWVFEGKSEAWVDDFIRQRQLPMMLERGILDRAIWHIDDSAVSVMPGTQLIRSIPSKARAEIYSVLATSDRNPDIVEPEVVYGASVEEWLREDGLREELVAFIRDCAYPRGGLTVFADKLAVYSGCRSDNERLRVRRAMSRNPTLVAKLVLGSGSPDALAKYWGRGFRLKDTLPFIRSMAKTRGADKIDIIHLLPAAMRKVLYTFPNPLSSRSGYLPDCHWTSLNFFNPEPLERLADPVQATAYVQEHFERVEAPYQLGDVLFLANPQTGAAYHSCSYIFDDVVMSKNGRSPIQPWVLMKLDQIRSLYGLHFKTEASNQANIPIAIMASKWRMRPGASETMISLSPLAASW